MENNRRTRAKALTNTQRDFILLKVTEAANDIHANKSDRITACIIGLILTTGMRLIEITSLMVDSMEVKFCEEKNRVGYYLKYVMSKGGTREQYCNDISAMFFRIAKELHDADNKVSSDRHIFVIYNNIGQGPTWISTSLFERYYSKFNAKYLAELKDDDGHPVKPTVHQYRQTYLKTQLEVQLKRYQHEDGSTELVFDDFERRVFC